MASKDTNALLGAKSSNTRKRILTSAAKVLSEKGYAGTRLSDIADIAQIRTPAIYYYFDSRDELIAEVVSHGSRLARDFVEASLLGAANDTSPLERIDIAIEAHLRLVLEVSDFTKASTRNMGQLPAWIRARQLEEQSKYGDLWRGLLRDAAEAGDIDESTDLGTARMLVLGALNWTPEWWTRERGSVDDLVVASQRFIRSGLTAVGNHTQKN